MTIKQQLIALYTLVRRELVRMFRIFSQVFFPPVITTMLYFLIFGSIIGQRIGPIQGMPYTLFIAPGLIMMSVIINAYSNVSTSVFTERFQKNIEEKLISPIYPGLMLLGFILGGMLRGVLVAILVYSVASFFIYIPIVNLPLTIIIIVLVAALFSLAGFTNGILARNFDDVAIVPTFILTPLTYLGGIFYLTTMLPPFWQKVSYFNPILYMVNALRHAMTGQRDVNMTLAMSIICAILALLLLFNLILLKKGTGIRD
ncbi:ABC transporter permease [Legionella septentrionalis]|uniref:ABC transporter permease n=1 Tax=Legionella septentrionalis TaxID=2498109 RepID=UPI000F8CFB10|nr:ABC transporter permease [Legionella septentrionalis]RUR15008.1 ABC transporter permease [Legionella septentrionalis]